MRALLLFGLLLVSIGSWGAQPASQPEPFDQSDPYESFNRSMFDFNMGVHRTLGRPIARAYDSLPAPAQKGLHNFFTNLSVPWTFLNDVLQGKGGKAATDFMRFAINTMFGLGGLLDIATEAGMDYQKEDLGQTLYAWGVWPRANFLILPLLGPYTTREAVGAGAQMAWDPVYDALLEADGDVELAMRLLDTTRSYAENAVLLDQLESQPDPYIFIREAYYQHRLDLIYDGHPPVPQDIDDIDL
ncbi:phospholipid-binding lipoprotein MlaA [Sulfurivirga caldicuralii]|uniref:Phospholipid-binding lipoprotein MlaA n=1 Tax=Sulfurivirga caldicuralii TaxID=364032 RepID=A0A1N6HBE2_9GAMM|nr:VacJ family lipoprotein [Sulfurivirga caldicuralii]SIO17090.1 phospholipid-binding lipoprotein MlaA [Sulfurivirga caldicuralii]